MRSCYHGVYGMIRNNISKFAKQSFWKMWEEIVMGKRSLISLFTIFAVLILVVLLRFDDIKKLLNRLNEDRNIKPLEPIVLSSTAPRDEKNIPLREQRSSVTERIPLDIDQIKQMREAGMTLQAIGDKMGVSASTISNRLKEIEQ